MSTTNVKAERLLDLKSRRATAFSEWLASTDRQISDNARRRFRRLTAVIAKLEEES